MLNQVVIPAAYHLSVLLVAGQTVDRQAVFSKTSSFPERFAWAMRSSFTSCCGRKTAAGSDARFLDAIRPQRRGRRVAASRGRRPARIPGGAATADRARAAPPSLPGGRRSGGSVPRLAESGVDLGPSFRLLRELWRGEGEALGFIDAVDGLEADGSLHPAQIDSCFHVLAAALQRDSAGPSIPFSIGQLRFRRGCAGPFWCHGHVKRSASDDVGFFRLFDESGELLAEIDELRVRPVSTADIVDRAAQSQVSGVYTVAWS